LFGLIIISSKYLAQVHKKTMGTAGAHAVIYTNIRVGMFVYFYAEACAGGRGDP
jgi:hypothetical protein